MLFLLLSACIDLESVGAYTCDEYCVQVIDKTEECAREAAVQACTEAGETDCPEFTEEELAAYASTSREDWADASSQEMVASCEDDLANSGKTDAACEAETATLNNLTCTQILDLIGALDG